MAYNRTVWKDHSVANPKTYRETKNADGTVTLTPAPGTVYQQGTPLSAANFNNLENGMMLYAAATDFLITRIGTLEMEMEDVKERLPAQA